MISLDGITAASVYHEWPRISCYGDGDIQPYVCSFEIEPDTQTQNSNDYLIAKESDPPELCADQRPAADGVIGHRHGDDSHPALPPAYPHLQGVPRIFSLPGWLWSLSTLCTKYGAQKMVDQP
jgi:hypothetical protein